MSRKRSALVQPTSQVACIHIDSPCGKVRGSNQQTKDSWQESNHTTQAQTGFVTRFAPVALHGRGSRGEGVDTAAGGREWRRQHGHRMDYVGMQQGQEWTRQQEEVKEAPEGGIQSSRDPLFKKIGLRGRF